MAEHSVVRKIWGKADTVLFIFGGAAAEFALNKSVDWLYFTGRLPNDPIGRLFSTVAYARRIIFAPRQQALAAIDSMRKIHKAVEQNRGSEIPGWAYRDVLFMLIHYSISAYELLERKLSDPEKEEVYDVFYRVGTRMGLEELPDNFLAWQAAREQHLQEHLEQSIYTKHLFKQYRKHLGIVRYAILLQAQAMVVPQRVARLLRMGRLHILTPLLQCYKLSRKIKADWLLKEILLPPAYRKQILALDIA